VAPATTDEAGEERVVVTERTPKTGPWLTKPAYLIVFQSSAELTDAYSPIVAFSSKKAAEDATVPHGFDRDLVPYLPALWYILHLPNTLADLEDLGAEFLKKRQEYDFAHDIILIPHAVFANFTGRLQARGSHTRPMIIFTADDLVAEVRGAAQALVQPVLVVPLSSLSASTISEHWQFVHRTLAPDSDYLGREPELLDRLDCAPLLLPIQLVRRQFDAAEPVPLPTTPEQMGKLGSYALRVQTVLSTTARLEGERRSRAEAERLLLDTYEEEHAGLSLPVAISAPGVPPAYRRHIRRQGGQSSRDTDWPAVDPLHTWASLRDAPDDLHAERGAVEFIATHRAVARTGLAFPLRAVSADLFGLLANLEDHCARGTPKPRAVWRWLREIGSRAAAMMDSSAVAAVAHASFLNVFSNFPMGLAVLPGDSAPLSCRVPIAYRPLLPLTRAVQAELTSPSMLYLGSNLRVLIAECIAEADPVGQLSRTGWDFIRKFHGRARGIDVDYVEVASAADLRAALRDGEPHALILSAHGFYSPETNAAGVMIGGEPYVGPRLGEMPPLVLLSACHVAPRGRGVVAIADLLLREGALAVLGTHIPVDPRHNVQLMSRFLTYIAEAFAGREPHRSLAEIWHRTAVSNAVMDVLHAARPSDEWARSRFGDSTVLQAFMRERSPGRLRLGSIYEDTQQVLLEMAAEVGMRERVEQWLTNPGYVPESLFYSFIGWPERIIAQDPYLSQMV